MVDGKGDGNQVFMHAESIPTLPHASVALGLFGRVGAY